MTSPIGTKNGKRILVIDPSQAGIAGNMILGALLDLGAPITRLHSILEWIRQTLSPEYSLELKDEIVSRHGIRGRYIDLLENLPDKQPKTQTDKKSIPIDDIFSGLGLLESIRTCLVAQNIPDAIIQIGLNAANSLIAAESVVHNEPIERVHLHEAGSCDTILDICGTIALLYDLELTPPQGGIIYGLPVALGSGKITFSHGTFTVPAPATLQILSANNYPMHGNQIAAELATPTGVALLTALVPKANRVSSFPMIQPLQVGFGAGTREFSHTANLLRAVMGTLVDSLSVESPSGLDGLSSSISPLRDNVMILETNVDDVTGEQLGFLVQRLMAQGALDTSLIPLITKKNRPGYLLQVISSPDTVNSLSTTITDILGTLGIRMIPCFRHILSREAQVVKLNHASGSYDVRVKISRDSSGRIVQIKPEADDISHLVLETGKTWRELDSIITHAIRQQLNLPEDF